MGVILYLGWRNAMKGYTLVELVVAMGAILAGLLIVTGLVIIVLAQLIF
jgi:Tfp pilus assembly protein PilW